MTLEILIELFAILALSWIIWVDLFLGIMLLIGFYKTSPDVKLASGEVVLKLFPFFVQECKESAKTIKGFLVAKIKNSKNGQKNK